MEIKIENIYAFKMTSGQEVVAKISSIDNDYYHLESPLTIGQGPNGMEFLDAMFCAERFEDVAMLKLSVSIVAPARQDIQAVYEESVNPTQILKPGQKQIITG